MTWNTDIRAIVGGLLGLGVSLGVTRYLMSPKATLSQKHPSERTPQFHHQENETQHSIPRLGGLSIVAGFLAACGFALYVGGTTLSKEGNLWAVLASSLAIFGVGIYDDFRPIGAKKKLLFQVLIAWGAYRLGIEIGSFRNPFNGQIYDIGLWSLPLTVFWLVAMTNLINLIDGIDGLAGGIGVLLMGLLAATGSASNSLFYTVSCFGVMGALLGFLRYNFPPAKIYLGDGGAYFIGFLIGCLSIETSQKGTIAAALTAPVLALALPILDTSLALLRRGVKGLPLFRPDLDHLHHRLVRQGLNRTKAVLILYGFSAIALTFAFGVFLLQGDHLALMIGGAGAALILMLRKLQLIPRFRSIREVVISSWMLRRHSRYALTLSAWLQMEAERRDQVEALWKDFLFMIERLGFAGARIQLAEASRSAIVEVMGKRMMRLQKTFPSRNMTLELVGVEGQLTSYEFGHLVELAAEAWLKSIVLWEQEHQRAAVFETQEELKPQGFGETLSALATHTPLTR